MNDLSEPIPSEHPRGYRQNAEQALGYFIEQKLEENKALLLTGENSTEREGDLLASYPGRVYKVETDDGHEEYLLTREMKGGRTLNVKITYDDEKTQEEPVIKSDFGDRRKTFYRVQNVLISGSKGEVIEVLDWIASGLQTYLEIREGDQANLDKKERQSFTPGKSGEEGNITMDRVAYLYDIEKLLHESDQFKPIEEIEFKYGMKAEEALAIVSTDEHKASDYSLRFFEATSPILNFSEGEMQGLACKIESSYRSYDHTLNIGIVATVMMPGGAVSERARKIAGERGEQLHEHYENTKALLRFYEDQVSEKKEQITFQLETGRLRLWHNGSFLRIGLAENSEEETVWHTGFGNVILPNEVGQPGGKDRQFLLYSFEEAERSVHLIDEIIAFEKRILTTLKQLEENQAVPTERKVIRR